MLPDSYKGRPQNVAKTVNRHTVFSLAGLVRDRRQSSNSLFKAMAVGCLSVNGPSASKRGFSLDLLPKSLRDPAYNVNFVRLVSYHGRVNLVTMGPSLFKPLSLTGQFGIPSAFCLIWARPSPSTQ